MDTASDLLRGVVNFIPQIQHNRIIFLLQQFNLSWQFHPHDIISLSIENKNNNQIVYINDNKIMYTNYYAFSITIVDNTLYYKNITTKQIITYQLQGNLQCSIADDVHIALLDNILTINQQLIINMLTKSITFYECTYHTQEINLVQDAVLVQLKQTTENNNSNISLNVKNYYYPDTASVSLLYALQINQLRLQYIHVTHNWFKQEKLYAYNLIKSNNNYKIIMSCDNISTANSYTDDNIMLNDLVSKLYSKFNYYYNK